jgi:antitoxin VapB
MAERHKKPTTGRRGQTKRGRAGLDQPETQVRELQESGQSIVGSVATQERRVRLFKNGRSQAVRIPREFELPGKEAIMRKEGERLIIEPAKPKSLLELLETLEPLDEEMPQIDDYLPEPVDL